MDHLKSFQINDKLFPTKTSFFIFWSYIALFVNQGLLVTAVQRSKIHGFNAIVVVLLTELVKLLICLIVYMSRAQWRLGNLFKDIRKNYRLLLLYLVPSFLYCLYNNLTFVNLELFDVTTYYCLMQFRIVLTAIIYQILFRRKLNLLQWVSLIILTFGCLIKEYSLYDDLSKVNNQTNHSSTTTESNKVNQLDEMAGTTTTINPVIHFAWLSMLLLLQIFCSCFAGVYNEFLLKDSSTANNADIILQNIFMYFDSILCNAIVYTMASNNHLNSSKSITYDVQLKTTLYNILSEPLALILIFNNALSGLVASFFLKSLNSILKTFASALELFAVAFLAWILFNNKVDIYTITALILVSLAMIVYSKNPVSVAPPSRLRTDDKDGFMLLPTSEE